MSRDAVDRTIRRVREEFSQRHGREPNGDQGRRIEQAVKRVAEQADRRKG